jgi:competence protein ComGC
MILIKKKGRLMFKMIFSIILISILTIITSCNKTKSNNNAEECIQLPGAPLPDVCKKD